MDTLRVIAVLFRAMEDGKITGKEVKEMLNILIPDDFEFSFDELETLIKSIVRKI
jgi:hypothetical protein